MTNHFKHAPFIQPFTIVVVVFPPEVRLKHIRDVQTDQKQQPGLHIDFCETDVGFKSLYFATSQISIAINIKVLQQQPKESK